MKAIKVRVDDHLDAWYQPETGEEALLAAILDRAIRDLNYEVGSVLPHHIKSALGWFNGYFDDSKDFIPYSRVCEILELSNTIKGHIEVLIESAERYLDERRRIGISGNRSGSERSLGIDGSERRSVERRIMGSARRFARWPKKRTDTLSMFRKGRRYA